MTMTPKQYQKYEKLFFGKCWDDSDDSDSDDDDDDEDEDDDDSDDEDCNFHNGEGSKNGPYKTGVRHQTRLLTEAEIAATPGLIEVEIHEKTTWYSAKRGAGSENFNPAMVSKLAELLGKTRIGMMYDADLFGALEIVGGLARDAKMGSRSIHKQNNRRGFQFLGHGLEDFGYNFASMNRVAPEALGVIVAYAARAADGAEPLNLRCHANGPTANGADALGGHVDAERWRKKKPEKKGLQVRVLWATAPVVLHYYVMAVTDKGKMIMSMGVFASIFVDVQAYEMYMLWDLAAGQRDFGFTRDVRFEDADDDWILVDVKNFALKIFHRVCGISYWRFVAILTWLAESRASIEEERERLRNWVATFPQDPNALPPCTLVAPTPEELHQFMLARCRDSYLQGIEHRRAYSRRYYWANLEMMRAAHARYRLRMRGGHAPFQGDWTCGAPQRQGPGVQTVAQAQVEDYLSSLRGCRITTLADLSDWRRNTLVRLWADAYGPFVPLPLYW